MLADRSFDADAPRIELLISGIEPVIPSKRNRNEPWPHDTDPYNLRSRVERAIGHLKQWRRVATCYGKTT